MNPSPPGRGRAPLAVSRALESSLVPPGFAAFWRPGTSIHTSEQVAISNLTTSVMKGAGGKSVETCKLAANEEN